ncbi:MAG: hypothetical protein JXR89_05840 [Deltaproteobacteria bacterium]|nr:hypothetical protein [Deltaproteobacteria bacterium]
MKQSKGKTALTAAIIFTLLTLASSASAMVLGSGMAIFDGVLQKIVEEKTAYRLQVDGAAFRIDRNDRALIRKAELLVGKKISLNYNQADGRVIGIKQFQEKGSK